MNAAALQQQKEFSFTAIISLNMWQAVTTGTVIDVVDQFQPLRLMPWDLCFSIKRPKYRYSHLRLIQKQPVRTNNDENEWLKVKLPFMVASARSYYECGLQLTRTVKGDLGALPSCQGMIRDMEYVKPLSRIQLRSIPVHQLLMNRSDWLVMFISYREVTRRSTGSVLFSVLEGTDMEFILRLYVQFTRYTSTSGHPSGKTK